MPATLQDLDQFHRFAREQISDPDCALTLVELMREWSRLRDRDEIHSIIRQGLCDIDAGLGVDAFEHLEEMRVKYGIPK